MEITSVIENTSLCGLPVEHGLCLWIEACGRRFFFDLGQSSLFAKNSAHLRINVDEAEFAVISHGHYDHGGGIVKFLDTNSHAAVYIHKDAFGEHYSLKGNGTRYIGLNKSLIGNERINLTDGYVNISDGIAIFDGCDGHDYFSPANRRILVQTSGGFKPDDFTHEQSILITEGPNAVLIAGCAHSGIVNIMRKAETMLKRPLTHVIAGMHLAGVNDELYIDALAQELLLHNCLYYTCHCTGEHAFNKLKEQMGHRIQYFSEGMTIRID